MSTIIRSLEALHLDGTLQTHHFNDENKFSTRISSSFHFLDKWDMAWENIEHLKNLVLHTIILIFSY